MVSKKFASAFERERDFSLPHQSDEVVMYQALDVLVKSASIGSTAILRLGAFISSSATVTGIISTSLPGPVNRAVYVLPTT